jgi:hypothetical protein
MIAIGGQVVVTCSSDFACGLMLRFDDKFPRPILNCDEGDSDQGSRLIIKQELLLVKSSSSKVFVLHQLFNQQTIYRHRAFSTQAEESKFDLLYHKYDCYGGKTSVQSQLLPTCRNANMP